VLQYERLLHLHASCMSQARFRRMTRQIASMMQPICCLAALILVYSQVVLRHPANALLSWRLLVYEERSGDSAATKLKGSLLDALTVLAAIASTTAVFVALFALRWRKVSEHTKLHCLHQWEPDA